jgi:tRNA-specific 2-thiouridylase
MESKWKLWQEYVTDNLTKATLHQFEEGMYVLFQEPQSAITAEFAAWYIEDELVGSGVIS